MEELIRELGNKVKSKKLTWEQASSIYSNKTKENISKEALRKKYERLKPLNNTKIEESDFETIYKDGSIEAQKIVEYNKEIFGDKNKLLDYLGYDHNVWEFQYITTSTWMQHTKEQTTKQLYAVKFKVKSIIKENITLNEALEVAINEFKEKIPKYTKKELKEKKLELDENKLLECPPVELHLGELSHQIDTGENYDIKIAQDRFNKIIDAIIERNKYEKCSTLLFSVGGDFFNSDNNFDTTNRGTQQYNDTRWRKLYLVGLKLMKNALIRLSNEFNRIDVQLVSGNHDLTTSFYLYIALAQAFTNSDKITFKEDYKEVQCYKFNDCMIVTTHGDRNVKRTMQSVVNEFADIYGRTKYRELHMGHLHSTQELKEEIGIIPRRISSPKGIGNWEYNERFGNTIEKHEIFIWEKGVGLTGIEMIPFEPVRKLEK